MFYSSVFDSGGWLLEVPWSSGGGGEIIWVSHEYGFGVGFFFLFISYLSSFGLLLEGGPVALGFSLLYQNLGFLLD